MKDSLQTRSKSSNAPRLGVMYVLLAQLFVMAGAQATESLTQVTKLSTRYDIQHYIKVADAEELLARMGAAGSIATTEGLTLLAKYVEANFQATGEFGAMRIETLSAEVDDQFVYIEQMTSPTVSGVLPQRLELESRLLQDLDNQAVSYIELQAGPQSTLMRATAGQPVKMLDSTERGILY